MNAIRKQTLYYLDVEVVAGNSYSIERGVSDFELWHSRLGQKSMKVLVKQGIFKSDDSADLKSCEQYIMGKSKKQPFPKGKHTSKSVLEYAYSDIWGPAQPATLNGGRYFISIIDDYSRKL